MKFAPRRLPTRYAPEDRIDVETFVQVCLSEAHETNQTLPNVALAH
jgi:hypothetical protein